MRPELSPDAGQPWARLGRAVAVLDGGLATTLEAAGHDLSGPLWSARLLADAPHGILAAHSAFFAAGAQVATTATYQLSGMSLRAAGADPARLGALVVKAVALAAQARQSVAPGALVAGSVGPYGASRADGSEYTGHYLLGRGAQAVRVLRDFHRPRLAALIDAGVDVLACETLPTAAEADALAAEIAALGVQLPVWFSFTPAPGGLATRTGEPLTAVARALADVPGLAGLGVNCCPPRDVGPALQALAEGAPGAPLVAYPNSGETWDATSRQWTGSPTWSPESMAAWRDKPVAATGGCCRVGPEHIQRLAELCSPGGLP
jgi:homocysteine S-methyltransferase